MSDWRTIFLAYQQNVVTPFSDADVRALGKVRSCGGGMYRKTDQLSEFNNASRTRSVKDASSEGMLAWNIRAHIGSDTRHSKLCSEVVSLLPFIDACGCLRLFSPTHLCPMPHRRNR